MISKHGAALTDRRARRALGSLLLPEAFLVTPNLAEAAELAGMPVDDLPSMKEAAARIASLGVEAVLVKGGHLEGDAVDLLLYRGEIALYRAPRIETRNTHGTGCTFSACITAELARGRTLAEAVGTAKHRAIETAPGPAAGGAESPCGSSRDSVRPAFQRPQETAE